jgi:hypothetical protein
MRLNVINNYKTIYYNFLASFYLCLNCVLPYYDDVIISLQSQAIKLLIDNDALNMKKVKKIRMIEFIDSLDKSDKIILDKEKDIILIDYCIYECHDDSNGSSSSSRPESGPEQETETETETDSNTNEVGAKDSEKTSSDSEKTSSDSEKTSSDSDPDKDPYEPRKKKSRIDNDYIPQPAGPMKDKDDYYNMGVYAVSATAAAAATAANNAAKYLIEDSGSNSADTTDTADTADTDEDGLDKEIDVSIRNIIQHIIYDKNKDD